MASPAEPLPLKIAHVFLKCRNSLRSDSLHFLTENFPVFLNAPELKAGSTITLFSGRKESQIAGFHTAGKIGPIWRGVKKFRVFALREKHKKLSEANGLFFLAKTMKF
ncbi:MAG: hypothetical protein K5856_04295 [Bacteroidaceae bacterium]|nr:hypothetical protein [Bacteroidaceae bacterium]